MADLISRAAAIEHMKEMAGCATCDNYNYVRCRACSWDDAMNIVEELPAVDAVSVEWLKRLMLSTDDDVDNVEFRWIMREWQKVREWQKEQEAR